MCDNLNRIITIEELMKLLNIGKNTAYRLLESREIKGFILGNKWKIPIESVNSYIIKMTDDTN
ncbi:MAG: helix-turn-helix domain-containing protein [Ruminococcus sp.]|mgnify:FL=1|nr:helix-turn-helix domain-containing protein [Ruminococcus sp.]MDE7138228.1 helix-turn-helix domain-containing protein [Ruminococcus sp.]